MADATTTRPQYTEPTDLLPDVAGVKSRVSWGAIVGGALTALASYLVLTLLLAAIGVTMNDQNVNVARPDIWITTAMITTIVVSLFFGGWVSSQLTAGENRQEAIIYGILTWAVVTGISLYMVSVGVKAGYFGLLGGSLVTQNSQDAPTIDEALSRFGYKPQEIEEIKRTAPEDLRQRMNDPAVREKASDAAVAASWSALVGVMLSMAAAVGGALAGVGTQFRLFPVDMSAGRRVMPTRV